MYIVYETFCEVCGYVVNEKDEKEDEYTDNIKKRKKERKLKEKEKLRMIQGEKSINTNILGKGTNMDMNEERNIWYMRENSNEESHMLNPIFPGGKLTF